MDVRTRAEIRVESRSTLPGMGQRQISLNLIKIIEAFRESLLPCCMLGNCVHLSRVNRKWRILLAYNNKVAHCLLGNCVHLSRVNRKWRILLAYII